MASSAGAPTYLGTGGPLGAGVAISSATAGAASLSATITTSSNHKIQEGNQIFITGSTGGVGTWNTTFYAHVLSPVTVSLWTTNVGAEIGASGFTSTLTTVPTLTNAKVFVINNVQNAGNNWFTDESPIAGTVIVTGDGTDSTTVVNFVDGTVTIPFTPTAVELFRVAGSETATTHPVAVSAMSTTAFTVVFSATTSSTQTLLFKVYR